MLENILTVNTHAQAADIPGVPAGDEDEGENYLEFLKLLKDVLPDGITLSIAAPSSYWYLKAFPIDKIGQVVDYIVYMTYDLHGQVCITPQQNVVQRHVVQWHTHDALQEPPLSSPNPHPCIQISTIYALYQMLTFHVSSSTTMAGNGLKKDAQRATVSGAMST